MTTVNDDAGTLMRARVRLAHNLYANTVHHITVRSAEAVERYWLDGDWYTHYIQFE